MLTALSAVLSPYHANWSIKGFLYFIYLLYSTYRPNISAGRGRAVELCGLRTLSATTIYRKLTQHDSTPPSEGVKSLPVMRPLRPRFHVTEVVNPQARTPLLPHEHLRPCKALVAPLTGSSTSYRTSSQVVNSSLTAASRPLRNSGPSSSTPPRREKGSGQM
jgi:hypothetical protein